MTGCKTGSFNDLHISQGSSIELLRREHKNDQDNSSRIVFKRDFQIGQIFWVPNQCWKSGCFMFARDSDAHPGLVLKDTMSSGTSLMAPGSTHAYNTEKKMAFCPEKAVDRCRSETCFLLKYRETIPSSEVCEYMATLHDHDIKRLEDKVRCWNALV